MIPTRNVLFVLLTAAVSAMAGVDPALLNLVMPDAQVLMGIQVQQSESSPLGQYLLSQVQSSSDSFSKFVMTTGFDPRRDLTEVVAATAGNPTAANRSGIVVGRGTFQPPKITAIATLAGGTVSTYRGISLISSAQPNSTGSLAFLDATTVVMGDPASVKGVIDRKLGSATFTGTLAQKAQDVSGTNNAWFVTAGPSQFLSGSLGGAQAQQGVVTLLQAILQISGGLQLGTTTVTLATEAVTRSDQDAQSIVNVLKFLVGMVQQNSDPRVAQGAALAQAAQVTAQGALVRITLSVPEQQLEQWLQIQTGKTKKTAGLLRQ